MLRLSRRKIHVAHLPGELGSIWGGFTAAAANGGVLIYSEAANSTKHISPWEDPLPLRNLLVLIKMAIKITCGSYESALAGLQSKSMGISGG